MRIDDKSAVRIVSELLSAWECEPGLCYGRIHDLAFLYWLWLGNKPYEFYLLNGVRCEQVGYAIAALEFAGKLNKRVLGNAAFAVPEQGTASEAAVGFIGTLDRLGVTKYDWDLKDFAAVVWAAVQLKRNHWPKEWPDADEIVEELSANGYRIEPERCNRLLSAARAVFK